MTEAAAETETETETESAETTPRKGLCRHKTRPEWGFAVLAWDEGDKRGYQFDDGKLRVFKEGFYELLEPVEDAGPGGAALESDLRATISGNTSTKAKAPLQAVYPFATQVEIFRKVFPEGFDGPSWIDKHRGSPDTKRLKRHRGPAATDAQQRLGHEWMNTELEAGNAGPVIDAMLDVLAHTSLVSSTEVTALAHMDDELQSTVATTLRNLLYGESKYGSRFTRWVAALGTARGKRPTWRLATAIPALVHPTLHTCVRHSVAIKQAALFLPDGAFTSTPRRSAYAAFLEVARKTNAELLEAGLHPRDLLDVHDFVWITLRPNALERTGT